MSNNDSSTLSFSESVNHMADRAFLAMDMAPDIAAAIKACNSTIKVNFPVNISNGNGMGAQRFSERCR